MITSINSGKALQNVTTTEDGRFLFTNLALAKYSLIAERRGFPTQGYDEHEGGFSTAIAVGSDKDSDNLVFRLKPGGSISGRVRDEQGDPVRDGQVLLFTEELGNGERRVYQRGQTMSDDQGFYHFAHLRSGTYFIVVYARPWYAQPPTSSGDVAARISNDALLDVAYPLTYYEQATEPSGASPIVLQNGDQVIADVSLTPVPALHIQVPGITSDPAEFVSVSAMQSVLGETKIPVPAQTLRLRPDMFEITGIAPGHYDLNVQLTTQRTTDVTQKTPNPNPPGNETKPTILSFSAELSHDGEIDRRDGPVSVPVRGTVKLDTPVNPPEWASIQFHKRGSMQSYGNAVSASGKFSDVILAPGVYEVGLPNSARLLVKSIFATGAKVRGQTIEVSGPDPVQITVVTTRGMGRVEGIVVRDEDQKPAAGAMVVLVPGDPANNSSLFRRDQSDSDGTFSLPAILPGRYTILALADGWGIEWANPAVLAQYMTKGESILVEANSTPKVTVQLQ